MVVGSWRGQRECVQVVVVVVGWWGTGRYRDRRGGEGGVFKGWWLDRGVSKEGVFKGWSWIIEGESGVKRLKGWWLDRGGGKEGMFEGKGGGNQ